MEEIEDYVRDEDEDEDVGERRKTPTIFDPEPKTEPMDSSTPVKKTGYVSPDLRVPILGNIQPWIDYGKSIVEKVESKKRRLLAKLGWGITLSLDPWAQGPGLPMNQLLTEDTSRPVPFQAPENPAWILGGKITIERVPRLILRDSFLNW